MRWAGLVCAAAVAGCAPKQTELRFPSAGTPVATAHTIEPSPLLKLVRSEREAAEAAIVTREAAAPVSDEPDEAASGNVDVRRVHVKTNRLATWESLARYALRYAEHRRPRRLHENRFLLRAASPPKAEGGTAQRAAVRKTLRGARQHIKRCLIAMETRQPGAIVKAPSALVVEQAMRRGDVQYHFAVHFDGAGTATVREEANDMDYEARQCIGDVVAAQAPDDLGAAELELVAFAQAAKSFGGHGLNASLANQAAALGWLRYEQGDYEDALSFFGDAYWIYERPEYKVLIGMALEKLARPQDAADAYADYVAQRGDAPDALELRLRIVQLRRA
ncbi:MAG: hypothetical protein AAF721_01735 [Myxococcota bacterium]